ncbi:MAG: hypothetical protein RIS59_180 [Pseudomonadota bacterium]|jgi:hypothetical protein
MQNDIKNDGTANLSVRGISPATMGALRQRALRDGSSINSVVVRLLDQGLGRPPAAGRLQTFDDLDALAGSWTAEEAEAFAADTRGFTTIDPAQWR